MNAFLEAFEPWARVVRRRLAWRGALIGGALGVLAAATGALVLWWFRLAGHDAHLGMLVVAGAAIGWLVTLLRRWPDLHVALFLDARLESRETISSAVARAANGASTDADLALYRRATAALERVPQGRATPMFRSPLLLAAPAGATLFVGVLALGPRVDAVRTVEPGAKTIQLQEVPGLDAVERLEGVGSPDAERARALARAAERARALRAALADGVEQRRALSELAAIRDDLHAARIDTTSERARAAAEALARQMRAMPALRKAADALERGDLVAFDEEMHALANRTESEARQAALEALEAARSRAARAGASDLAHALGRQKELFEERMREAERVRELARALRDRLDPSAREALGKFDATGSLEAQAALTEALDEALGTLSEAERKALADALSRDIESGEGSAVLTKEQRRHLVEQLQTAEGRQRLSQTLRRLARAEPSADALRRHALDDAERGADQAARELGVIPVPSDSPGEGRATAGSPPRSGDPTSADGVDRPGAASEGAGPGGGASPGASATGPPIGSESIVAKAETQLDPTAPTLWAGSGRRPADAPPAAASTEPEGDVDTARARTLRGVDRTDLPAAYREQVRRYFSP